LLLGHKGLMKTHGTGGVRFGKLPQALDKPEIGIQD
jgi:hypothetical protein